jgi:hypothetical protein
VGLQVKLGPLRREGGGNIAEGSHRRYSLCESFVQSLGQAVCPSTDPIHPYGKQLGIQALKASFDPFGHENHLDESIRIRLHTEILECRIDRFAWSLNYKDHGQAGSTLEALLTPPVQPASLGLCGLQAFEEDRLGKGVAHDGQVGHGSGSKECTVGIEKDRKEGQWRQSAQASSTKERALCPSRRGTLREPFQGDGTGARTGLGVQLEIRDNQLDIGLKIEHLQCGTKVSSLSQSMGSK